MELLIPEIKKIAEYIREAKIGRMEAACEKLK